MTMQPIKGVINVSQIGLTDTYLTFDDEQKYQMCKKVLTEALKAMQVKATVDERKKVMNSILENSISLYEALERYEDCMVLADLKEVLNKEY